MNNKNTGNRNVGNKNNLANRNTGSANKNAGSANRNNGNANSNRNLTNNFSNNSNNNTNSSNNSQNTSIVKDVIVAVLVLIVVGVLVYFATNFLRKYLLGKSDQPWILQDSKNSKNSLVVTQDPRNENSITLYRSDDAASGAEFTYSFWFAIENMEYKYGELKHMFHKGNKSGNPNRAPGVFLHPTSNTILVYMNTVNNIMEHVEIKNIPLRRWVHMAIILKGQYLDVYVNGFLRKRHELSSVPKQNFGDLWLNLNGGFDGYMCKMRYYRRAIEYNEVENVVRGGPSEAVCGDTGEKPPYLDDNWWFDF
tara:strand:+ start:459 stop:1385 length:927 start_codon:yes stop_codon:yes gene_type:complete